MNKDEIVLWEALSSLETYLRSGIAAQIQTARSFGGEDMEPVHAAFRTLRTLGPRLSRPVYESAEAAINVCQIQLNEFLNGLRRTLEDRAAGRDERPSTDVANQQLNLALHLYMTELDKVEACLRGQSPQTSAPATGDSGKGLSEERPFDVFISFKNMTADGFQSRDSQLAWELYDFLWRKGLRVFFSKVSLEQIGESAYKKSIDNALDMAQVLVAVGTTRQNLESDWVRYEWDSFYNDVLSGVKPSGRIFSYLEGVTIPELPRTLRQTQAFIHSEHSMEDLSRFIQNALSSSVPNT